MATMYTILHKLIRNLILEGIFILHQSSHVQNLGNEHIIIFGQQTLSKNNERCAVVLANQHICIVFLFSSIGDQNCP